MPFLSGVELSYLPQKQQKEVFRYLAGHPCSVTVAQAKHLRELCKQSRLSQSIIADVLKKKAEEKRKVQDIPESGLFPEYFPAYYSREKRQEIMGALLKKWKEGEIQL